MRCRVDGAVLGRPGIGLAARVAGSVAVFVARLGLAWRLGSGVGLCTARLKILTVGLLVNPLLRIHPRRLHYASRAAAAGVVR